MSEEGNNGRSKGPQTEHSAGGAQDCSRTTALHVTAFHGKKEVTLAVEDYLWAPIGQAAQCSLAVAGGLLRPPPNFLKGLLPIWHLTLWPLKEE